MHRSKITVVVLLALLATMFIWASSANATKDNTRPISVKTILAPAPNPNWDLKAQTNPESKDDPPNPNAQTVAQTPEGSMSIGDDCTNPILISIPANLPYTDAAQTTCGRGNTYDNTCLGDYDGGEDIMYKLTVTSSVVVDIRLDPKTTRYTGFLLDNACPPNPTTCLQKKTNAFNFPYSMTGVSLAPGDYYIMVDTWPAPDCISTFDLTITEVPPPPPPPANDNCASATPIGDVTNLAWSTAAATFDGPGGYITSPNIWYVYTATCNGTATASLCGSSFDTKIRVFAGGTCSFGTVVATNDDYCSRQSQATFPVTTGSQFLIEVGGYSSYTGAGVLTTSCFGPPSNDNCANAQPIGDVTNLAWSTTRATNDGPGGYIVSPNIWYLYTASCDGAVTVGLCGSTFDTKLRVWAGNTCDFNTLVTQDDDGCGGLQSRVTFVAAVGAQFLIEVGGYSSYAGDGVISTSCSLLPTDNCSDAIPHTLAPGVTTVIYGNNLGSTNDCSLLPTIGESWQAFTINECMDVTISFCGTAPVFGNVYTVVAEGCPCGNLLFDDGWNATDCADGNFAVHWLHLAPGTYYYPVLMDDFNNAAGPYQLNVTGTPCPPGYCPASGYVCDEYISNVQVGTINNSSACAWYSDYTGLSTTMTQGVSYPITVTNGTPYSSDQCGIWADWNHDFDFDDAGELIAVSGTPGGGPYTANLMPPCGGYVGDTRLRIRITYTSTLSPCNNAEYGEVEDYTVNIQAAPTMSPTAIIAPNPQYAYYQFALTPVVDSFHFGQFSDGHIAEDVSLASVKINGLTPTSASVVAGYSGLYCSAVSVTMPLTEFIAPYGVLYDTTVTTFTVTGNFNDATPFAIDGNVTFIGHKSIGPMQYIAPPNIVVVPGDFDLSGIVNISDAVSILNYIFADGFAPSNALIGDVDCSGVVNISDAVYLMQYVFSGGAAPCQGGK